MKEIILKVEGMHCSGCENRIKNALEDIDGIDEVLPSHTDGIVKLKLNKNIDIDVIKETIEDIGFDVKED